MRLLLVSLLIALWPASADAGWKRAETAHFRVWADSSEAHLREQAALLEDYRSLLEMATGKAPARDAPPLDVFLVDDLAEATPWRTMGPDVAGYYRADAGRISAVATEKAGHDRFAISGQHILLHEYAHHFMLARAGVAHPAWYVEGFAEYFSTAVFRPERIEFGLANSNRAAWLLTTTWLPLERILARDPELLKSRDSAMYYAQSWLLTHYMFRAPGMRGKLKAYLGAFAQGEDPVEAFRRHVDPDLVGFQARLRRYLEDGATYSRFDRPRASPAHVRIVALPPSADVFLLRQAALEHGVPSARGPEVLAEIRRLAAVDPGDPMARRALALAELELGDAVTARRLLEGLLTDTPNDPDLLRWRALALKPLAPEATSESFDQARASLIRATEIAPDDWRALHAYARLYRPVAGRLPPEAMDKLVKAWMLAPQVTEVVLDTAVALSHAGRLEEAARVLEPLAWSPHAGPAAELAARMLTRARQGDKAGLLAEVSALRVRQQALAAAMRVRPVSGQR